MGSACSVRFGSCRGQRGICKTSSGCTDREDCPGGVAAFDQNDFFDKCGCAPAPAPSIPTTSPTASPTAADSEIESSPETGKCGELGSVCDVETNCNGKKGICKTKNGFTERKEGTNSFDKNGFFDKCVCTEQENPPSAPAPSPPETGACGELGSVCRVERSCNGMEGICKTKNGFTRREDSTSSFDQNGFFDECECTGPKDAPIRGFAGMIFVLLATISGLVICWFGTKRLSAMDIEVPKILYAPLGAGAFYSLFAFGFSVLVQSAGHQIDDFFTSFALTFILMILCVGSIPAACKLKSCFGAVEIAVIMVYAFCAMAGFFAFTFSVAIFAVASGVFFLLMGVVIRCLRSTWADAEKPDLEEARLEDQVDDARQAALRTVRALCNLFGGNLLTFCMRVFNFVLQAVLISYSIGDLRGLRSEVRAYFAWSLDLSVSMPELSWCSPVVEPAAQASEKLGDAVEHLSRFLLDYTLIWTPNMVAAYTSVGVFEVFVVTAALSVVLSDILLILAPRDKSGRMAKFIVELVSRGVLYTIQTLASASNVLIMALLFIQPIKRPELSESQAFFNENTDKFGVPVTIAYVCLTLLVAAYFLWKLWSGSDAGLQNIAPQLLAMHGVSIKETKAGQSSCCAFLFAFVGVWPQHVLDAFEVEQRSLSFRIDKQDIMLTTVNALSFPLYVLPFGGVIAKLGEYLNQCPIYVTGRGFLWSSLCIALTYFAEYVLVLVVCNDALTSVEQGLADTQMEAEHRTDGGKLAAVLICLLILALVRFVVGMADKLYPVFAAGATLVTPVVEPYVDVLPREGKPIAGDAVETNSNASHPSLEDISNSSGNSVVSCVSWL